MPHLARKHPCHKQGTQNPRSELFAPVRVLVRRLKGKLRFTMQIAHERNNLRHLSDYQLRDIGLTRDQVDFEAGKGFFDTPSARFGEFEFPQTRLRNVRPSAIHQLPEE